MLNKRELLVGLVVTGASFLGGEERPMAQGEPLGFPTTGRILTVSGKIRGGSVDFDMHGLEAFGLSGFRTTTPWYEGKTSFQGVLLDVLMRHLGCYGTTVRVYALDDYFVEIPVSDFSRYGSLLATRKNGAYMPIDDRGPLWVMYPFDTRSVLQQNLYYGRCVWQLQRFEVA
jgi:hypothetical protein